MCGKRPCKRCANKSIGKMAEKKSKNKVDNSLSLFKGKGENRELDVMTFGKVSGLAFLGWGASNIATAQANIMLTNEGAEPDKALGDKTAIAKVVAGGLAAFFAPKVSQNYALEIASTGVGMVLSGAQDFARANIGDEPKALVEQFVGADNGVEKVTTVTSPRIGLSQYLPEMNRQRVPVATQREMVFQN